MIGSMAALLKRYCAVHLGFMIWGVGFRELYGIESMAALLHHHCAVLGGAGVVAFKAHNLMQRRAHTRVPPDADRPKVARVR
jgi:hypothetical protein